jgi:nucleotide-binding universal stress UspA family protein
VPLTELVVPVDMTRPRDRGVDLAARWSQLWELPVRLVHVGPADDPIDEDDLTAAARALAASWQIEASGEVVIADDVGQGVVSTTTPGSLLVLATDHVDQAIGPGSAGEHIVRAVSNPVILCGPRCIDPPDTGAVVVALDLSRWAESAIGPASLLAAKSSETLWVLHVAPIAAIAHAEKLREEGHRVSVSAYIRGVADRLDNEGVDVGWELVQGNAIDGIVQFARNRGARLVAMTTHGESGLARRVLGSVSMGVVRTSTVPILIVPTDARCSSELP